MARMLPHFLVQASRRSGGWLTHPEYVGEVDRHRFMERDDTAIESYLIREFKDEAMPPNRVLAAVTVIWRP